MNTLIKLSAGMIIIMLCASPSFSYPKVHIKNNTKFAVRGSVNYTYLIAWGCSSDTYKIAPWGSWTGPYRGGCLISEINVNYGNNYGQSYTSGTGSVYAYFVIDKKSNGELEVKHSP